MITIICPVYNEEDFVARCIETMYAQDFPAENMELLIVDGRSTDRTREIAERLCSASPGKMSVRLLDNPGRTAPCALNAGIREARGEIIMRIDAHSDYPVNYVSTLVRKLAELRADNVGGVWYTRPRRCRNIAIAIAEASSHPFGVGNSEFRIGSKEIREVNTVPFGCYRRDVFDRIGLFDEELTRNQDNELNARLKNAGGKIYLIPQVVINYTARDTWPKIYRMYFQYALFSPLVNRKLGKPDSARRYLPALALCVAPAGIALGFVFPAVWWLMISAAALYILAGAVIGAQKAWKWKKPLLIICIPVTFFLMHWAYAVGYLAGKYRLLAGKPFHVEANR